MQFLKFFDIDNMVCRVCLCFDIRSRFPNSSIKNFFHNIKTFFLIKHIPYHNSHKHWLFFVIVFFYELCLWQVHKRHIQVFDFRPFRWFVSLFLQFSIDRRNSFFWTTFAVDILWIFMKSIYSLFFSKISHIKLL